VKSEATLLAPPGSATLARHVRSARVLNGPDSPRSRPVARRSVRLDDAVAGQAGVTRSRARALVMAGRVRLAGRPLLKPGTSVPPDAPLEIERPRPYVSRGGEKLEGALRDFALDVAGTYALDVGASTGGFTDCLLAHGAAHVVALDVGYGQLAQSVRDDLRVTTIERCNFRLLPDDAFARPFDVVTIDASFIALAVLVARARAYLAPGGTIVALLKPQFEAGRARLGRGGVVRDPCTHRAILHEADAALGALGLRVTAAARSGLVGPAGNAEFFLRLARDGTPVAPDRLDALAPDAPRGTQP